MHFKDSLGFGNKQKIDCNPNDICFEKHHYSSKPAACRPAAGSPAA